MSYLYANISGHRLGNSLFMAASTIGIARANNMQPLFPANWKYRKDFNIPDSMFGDCQIQAVYKEPHFHFCAPDIEDKNTELQGYFQSEQYFHNVKDEIKLYLTPKGSLPGSLDAVSIHHRRGDYINNPNYQQLGINYYISAYDAFFKGKEIKRFCEDHKYIDLHYNGNTLKSTPTNEIADFKGMIACKNHILSNSTFAWWAAYLSGSDNVVRPAKYFDGPLAQRSQEKDFYPLKWINWANHFRPELRDCTFIIPVMYDHKDREDNLKAVVTFLNQNFETSIIIGEINTDKFKEIHYNRITYKMPTFHRTKVLNELTREAKTKYVFNFDADIILPPWQIYKTIEALRNGADIVYPYDGTFACVSRNEIAPFNQSLDAGAWAGKQFRNWGNPIKSVGGALCYNKESFLKAGGENEHFISYSPEDQERYLRFKTLGLDVQRINGWLFHMDHYRGPDSREGHSNARANHILWGQIQKMNKEQMQDYVKTFNWS